MVLLLELEKTDYTRMGEFLTSAGCDVKISRSERDICTCSQIIIPPIADYKAVMKKLHLCNLYSILRMVKKPILGLGSGTQIMFECTENIQNNGLGYFCCPGIKSEYQITESGFQQVHLVSDAGLVQGLPDEFEMSFSEGSLISSDTPGTIAVLKNKPEYAVMFQSGMFQAVLSNVVESAQWGEQIIRNFVSGN
ncbi:MAG: hypothetical protein LWX56_08350 [Ignavibacteria bacterium]|nr:hypothetical protein [Ignavibacteria bacterium]